VWTLKRLYTDGDLPVTIIRPPMIYGPRDRTVLPKLLVRLKAGQVKYFGSGEQFMNNTFVGNLVDVIGPRAKSRPFQFAADRVRDGILSWCRELVL
jgi:nucleoside-diphosphate-sugar epimerase